VNLPRSTNYSINENSANSQKRIEADQRQKKSNSQYVNISNVTVIEQQRQFRSSHKGPESESYVKSPFVKGGQKNMSNQSLQNKLTTDYKNHSLYSQEAASEEQNDALIPRTTSNWNRTNSPMNPNKLNRQIISPTDPNFSLEMSESNQDLNAAV
jgi:hypothetical protein